MSTDADLLSLFEVGGKDPRRLRRENPVPVFDDKVEFYEYVVIDVRTRRKLEHTIDHDTGAHKKPLPRWGIVAEHKYFVHTIPQKGSATGYVHSFFEHFDSEAQARRISESDRILEDPDYKYFLVGLQEFQQDWRTQCGPDDDERFWYLFSHLSPLAAEQYRNFRGIPVLDEDDILLLPDFERAYRKTAYKATLDQWSAISVAALTLGRAMHRAIELCYNGALNPLEAVFFTPEMQQFARFHKFWVLPRQLTMFRTELSLAHCPDPKTPHVYLCGTIDAVFRQPDGGIVLVDWKRSKEIKQRAFRDSDVGTGPCQGMPNCNLYHYYMQLNTYKYMLEQNSEFCVQSCHIAVFHPNQADYAVYDVPDYQIRVAQAMRMYGTRRHKIDEHVNDDE